jgi:hypothetical protein
LGKLVIVGNLLGKGLEGGVWKVEDGRRMAWRGSWAKGQLSTGTGRVLERRRGDSSSAYRQEKHSATERARQREDTAVTASNTRHVGLILDEELDAAPSFSSGAS